MEWRKILNGAPSPRLAHGTTGILCVSESILPVWINLVEKNRKKIAGDSCSFAPFLTLKENISVLPASILVKIACVSSSVPVVIFQPAVAPKYVAVPLF
jgi:hypothetical protein